MVASGKGRSDPVADNYTAAGRQQNRRVEVSEAHQNGNRARQGPKLMSRSHPDLPYTAFLFEPLGDDCNGLPLVLASILGRMSLDPWSEAASLAAMPADAATQKLASLIHSMPNHALLLPESNTLAERLIRLLPTRSKPPGAATKSLVENHADAHIDRHESKGLPLLTYLGWIVLLCVVLVGASLG